MKLKKEKISLMKEDELLNLDEILELLGRETRREEIERLTKETYSLIKIKFLEAGGLFYEDINQLYKNLKGNFIVRVESPTALVELITKHKDLEISPSGNYPNAVEWRPEFEARGLRDAFIEGGAMLGGLVTLVGFRENKETKVEDVSVEEKNVFGRKRDLVRIAKGRVHPEDVQFVILRMPIKYFPAEEITPQEQKDIQKYHQPYIFRGFAFNESAAAAKEKKKKVAS